MSSQSICYRPEIPPQRQLDRRNLRVIVSTFQRTNRLSDLHRSFRTSSPSYDFPRHVLSCPCLVDSLLGLQFRQNTHVGLLDAERRLSSRFGKKSLRSGSLPHHLSAPFSFLGYSSQPPACALLQINF
jgi:hypothetical protein